MIKTIKFFITPVYPYGNDHYYHEMIAVAEGFRELGHKVIGNCNYWLEPETNTFLVQEDLDNTQFDIAVYDYRYVTSFAHLLFRKGYPNFDKKKIHILIDRNDWLQPIWWKNDDYKIFNIIFAGNLYENVTYPANVYPWAIGLTNRIIKSIDKCYHADASRDAVTGYNFRVNHNMRGYLLKKLQEKLKTYPAAERFTQPPSGESADAFYYRTSIRRHNPQYYQMLCKTRLFMAFGGYYEFRPFKYLPYTFLDKVLRKPFYWKYKSLEGKGKDFSNEIFIFQQDNFRFWEVLYSGAIAINLDLEYWNFKLPVMPVVGVHYLGVGKLNDTAIENTIAGLTEQQLQQMSENARRWVFENYSPKAQAERILSHL